ncbi:MAG TPA: HEAT repeat domain-containing protein [Armatimonadota bacterium]|nr:HEAT repeat domain-containing protein [Armatimonadota bacterium]
MEQWDITSADTKEKVRFLESILEADTAWDCLGMIASLATDPAAEVRELALKAFWDCADPRYLDLILDAACEDTEIDVRRSAIAALGRYVYDGFVLEELDESDFNDVKNVLLTTHQNPDEPLDIRRTALEALGFITDEEIENLIGTAYRNPERMMRISAIFAMGRSGTRTWDDIIKAELRSRDHEMLFEAIRAAGETYLQSVAPSLEELTENPDRDIRLAAINALGKAGRPESVSVLRRHALSADEDIRDIAAAALIDFDIFQSDAAVEGDDKDW